MSSVDKELLLLAATFLDEYSDRLGNDGCNDWEYPEHLSAEARVLLADDEYREDFDGVPPPNWMAVDSVKRVLESLAEDIPESQTDMEPWLWLGAKTCESPFVLQSPAGGRLAISEDARRRMVACIKYCDGMAIEELEA